MADDERLPRVVLVGPAPPPAGGMAGQTLQLKRLLEGEGVRVQFVQTNPPYRPAWLGRVKGLRAFGRLLSYVASLRAACRDGDVMHVMANSGWSWHLFALPAMVVGHRAGLRVVVNYRGGLLAEFLARQARVVLPSLRLADALVVPSEFLESVFARHGVASQIIPNILDASRFLAREDGPLSEAPHFVVTRNLEAIYDISTALQAFRRILDDYPQARMTVAGSGPLADALAAEARTLALDHAVHFAGRLDREAIDALYAEADVLLNPSTADNMPNSLLEAFAAGVLVVSTDVGGVPYIASDGDSALLVPPRDPAAMAEAALRLCGDEALQATLRHGARAQAERYTWSRVWPAWRACYCAEPLSQAGTHSGHKLTA